MLEPISRNEIRPEFVEDALESGAFHNEVNITKPAVTDPPERIGNGGIRSEFEEDAFASGAFRNEEDEHSAVHSNSTPQQIEIKREPTPEQTEIDKTEKRWKNLAKKVIKFQVHTKFTAGGIRTSFRNREVTLKEDAGGFSTVALDGGHLLRTGLGTEGLDFGLMGWQSTHADPGTIFISFGELTKASIEENSDLPEPYLNGQERCIVVNVAAEHLPNPFYSLNFDSRPDHQRSTVYFGFVFSDEHYFDLFPALLRSDPDNAPAHFRRFLETIAPGLIVTDTGDLEIQYHTVTRQPFQQPPAETGKRNPLLKWLLGEAKVEPVQPVKQPIIESVPMKDEEGNVIVKNGAGEIVQPGILLAPTTKLVIVDAYKLQGYREYRDEFSPRSGFNPVLDVFPPSNS